MGRGVGKWKKEVFWRKGLIVYTPSFFRRKRTSYVLLGDRKFFFIRRIFKGERTVGRHMEGILNEQSLHAVGKEKKKGNSNKKVSSPSPLNSLSQELDEGAQEKKREI